MTRLWADGLLIAVAGTEQPTSFHWQGRLHRIQGITNQWRVDLGWWRLRVWRDYFKVYTHSGLLVILYHDLLTDEWFLLRVYD